MCSKKFTLHGTRYEGKKNGGDIGLEDGQDWLVPAPEAVFGF